MQTRVDQLTIGQSVQFIGEEPLTIVAIGDAPDGDIVLHFSDGSYEFKPEWAMLEVV